MSFFDASAAGRRFGTLFLGFLLSLYAAWLINAQLDYGYSWLYYWMSIDQHIEYFAPLNRFRDGFHLLDSDQHIQLFQQICVSVHNQGQGLSDILYPVGQGQVSLLHHAEVVHLQDVANLIDQIHVLAMVVTILWLLLLILPFVFPVFKRKAAAKFVGLFFIGVVVATIVTVFVLGPKSVFYKMHTWVFPDNHQWFFYYQDSLMSTMMKAPDLFAGIAVQILLLGCILFLMGLGFSKKIYEVKILPGE